MLVTLQTPILFSKQRELKARPKTHSQTHIRFSSIYQVRKDMIKEVIIQTSLSDCAALRNLLMNTYGVGKQKLNCKVFRH